MGLVDLLVPLASSWKPVPVALGVVGLYLLVAIEVTSLLQRHLSRAAWRRVHLSSYGLFVVATLHALTAGTDVRMVLAGGVTLGLGTVVVLLGALAWVARSEPRTSGRVGTVAR